MMANIYHIHQSIPWNAPIEVLRRPEVIVMAAIRLWNFPKQLFHHLRYSDKSLNRKSVCSPDMIAD